MNVTTALKSPANIAAYALLALSGATFGTPVLAQSDILLQLAQCGELPDDSERLACYDRLTVDEHVTNAAAIVETASSPTSAAVSIEAGEPAAVAGSAAPADAFVPQVPATAPAVPEDQPVFVSATEPDEPELISVVSVRRNLSGLSVFETADGAIWVQTDITSRRYPPIPFSARIERALLRGYFLRVLDEGFRVRVRKLE